jgi:lambda family phage portal protein
MARPVTLKASRLDRFLLNVAPTWAWSRLRARAAAQTLLRHYEAASAGRRTENWPRSNTDANAAAGGSLSTLRNLARDLARNNAWGRRALQIYSNNTIGWGIVPKPPPTMARSQAFRSAWNRWSNSTECDADGRLTYYGLQRQVMRTVAESGEVLIRRRPRRAADGLAIPLQLQVLEPDFIDTLKDSETSQAGGPIVQGVEFDSIGRRAAYWLFATHPGSNRLLKSFASRRVPASEIIHVFEMLRPGQVRGVSWFAPIFVKIRDLHEYDDATLMRAKIAACFTAFVTDPNGVPGELGEQSTTNALVETMEPGMILHTQPGQEVTFGTPPVVSEFSPYLSAVLHTIAAGLGVSYEDLTADFSQVNFSSARLARISFRANVEDWQWNMMIPQFGHGTWDWVRDAAELEGLIPREEIWETAQWTPPALPMIEPDKEGLAMQRLVRSGALTPDGMVRQQGEDPEEHWQEYAANMRRLDDLGITLDSDPRKVSQSGQGQVNQKGGKAGSGTASSGGRDGAAEES